MPACHTSPGRVGGKKTGRGDAPCRTGRQTTDDPTIKKCRGPHTGRQAGVVVHLCMGWELTHCRESSLVETPLGSVRSPHRFNVLWWKLLLTISRRGNAPSFPSSDPRCIDSVNAADGEGLPPQSASSSSVAVQRLPPSARASSAAGGGIGGWGHGDRPQQSIWSSARAQVMRGVGRLII